MSAAPLAVERGVAKLIVGGPLLGVLQHLVGFLELLELGLGVRLLADIGVVLVRETAVCLLDLVRTRAARDAEYLVVVVAAWLLWRNRETIKTTLRTRLAASESLSRA